MSEIGEGVAVAKPVEAPKKGKIKVSVRDACTEKRVSGALVKINGKSQETKEGEDVVFSDQAVGVTKVNISKHFKDVDYSTFIVHYPRILRSHEAKSAESDLIEVKSNEESKIRIDIETYKLVGKIVFHRKHIDLGGRDKYGHWWTVVDDDISFGWWPKYKLGSNENQANDPPKEPLPLPSNASNLKKIEHKFSTAVYSIKKRMHDFKESSPGQTLRGVEGELNGQTSFGGTVLKDPHHSDESDEQYQPVRNDCFDLSKIKDCISSFSKSYSGSWSWRFESGNHCHTFQKRLIEHCMLDKVKVLK